MCISATVGAGGTNQRGDVRCVQLVLNMNQQACGLAKPLVTDGLWGPASLAALKAFQSSANLESSGLCAPGEPTLAALRQTLPPGLTREKFWGTMAGAAQDLIDRYFGPLAAVLKDNGIDTPLRMAHFLAQVGHECCDLRYPEEIADGSAYEGRKDLGNTEPGDGKLFKGRGLIQLTGRTNYTSYSQARGRDFVSGDNPRLIATDPGLAIDAACWFWTTRKINALADADDVEGVTRRVNGGLNGIDDRKARLARAKWFLVP